MYLRDYRLRKTWLCKCLKSRVSENRSTDNMANLSKHCCDLNDSTFTKVIDHCDDSSIGKKCLLVLYNILRLFLNTLTADDKHYLLTTDNLMQPIQMQLSQKPKPFSQFFFVFFEFIWNSKHLPTKDHRHSWSISGNTDSKKYG